jgi:hypothetical protein
MQHTKYATFFALFLTAALAAPAAADAPAGHFVSTTGTVADAATQLTWQKAASAATYTLTQAEMYCAALDLEGTGWRLPTIKELLTLVDETRSMPSIDPRAFPKTALDFYWTSSHVAGSATDVWAVSFRFGFDSSFDIRTQQHVRCVR